MKLVIVSDTDLILDAPITDGAYKVYSAHTSQGKAIVKKDIDHSAKVQSLPTKDLAKAEVATYKLAEWLGFHNVPTTVLKELPELGLVSIQDWVDAIPASKASADELKQVPQSDKLCIAILDGITGNWDRHKDNWLVTKDHNAVAIDNSSGLQFGNINVKDAVAAFYISLADLDVTPRACMIPSDIAAKVLKMVSHDKQDEVTELFTSVGFDKYVAKTAIVRARQLLQHFITEGYIR